MILEASPFARFYHHPKCNHACIHLRNSILEGPFHRHPSPILRLINLQDEVFARLDDLAHYLQEEGDYGKVVMFSLIFLTTIREYRDHNDLAR